MEKETVNSGHPGKDGGYARGPAEFGRKRKLKIEQKTDN